MRFVKEGVIKATPERVFAFHELPDAFERLIPPWENARILQKADISQLGSRAIVEFRILGLFRERWVAEHTVYDPPRSFEDIQVSGPFKNWRHRHIFEPHFEGAMMRDEIDFGLPFGWLGDIAVKYAVLRKLEKMFDYRHAVTRKWCESGI